MANRLNLQTILEDVLGSNNVYFQPPATMKMSYPAIRYVRDSIDKNYANDNSYIRNHPYEVTLITYDPDDETIEKLLSIPYTSYVRHYVADNLYHDVFTIYY